MIDSVLVEAETLLDAPGLPMPYAEEALAALGGFAAGDDEAEALILCVAAGDDGVRLGVLARFFEPLEERSVMLGDGPAMGPEFVARVRRQAGLDTRLEATLLASGRPAALSAAHAAGWPVLGFAREPAPWPTFADWIDVPAIVAVRFTPAVEVNRERAIRLVLEARHGISGFRSRRGSRDGVVRGHGQRLWPLHDPRLGELDGVLVPVPAEVVVRGSTDTLIDDVEIARPSDDAIEETRAFVVDLVTRGQVGVAGQRTPGALYGVETDPDGRQRLVRLRMAGS